MIKIGFAIDSLEMGGAEKLLVDIINSLSETKKYKIVLLTKRKSESYFYEQIKNKVEYKYLVENSNKGIISSLKKKYKFYKFQKSCDILIDFLDGDFYKYFRKIKGKKKITFIQGAYEKLIESKKIDKKIKYYDEIVIPTDEMYEEVKRLYPNKKIKRIYNYVDFENIDNKLRDEIEKEKNKDLLEEKFFLTVCRLSEKEKDVETIIRAFKNYTGEEKLYIIGDGEDRGYLERLTKKLDLENRVIFLGTKTNPFIFMEKTKGFIFSSKGEGFGLVLVEALYCGARIISSNCKYGPEEILENGKLGDIFSVGNAQELLQKMNEIDKKEISREDIIESLKKYSKNVLIEKYEELIKC